MNSTLINDFKELHQIPEEGFKEYKTHQYILDKLKKLNCVIYELEPTGIVAFFDYKRNFTIAFRCEMDGLPIIENTDLEYNSLHEGFMHACAHDAHMAIMLSLASFLAENKCSKNICIIFQPSEETFGGSLKIINSDIYKKLQIKEIYALHLWPGLKKGFICSKGNTLMANATEIDIEIFGKSAHIANKDEGIDAIKIAFNLLNKIEDEIDVFFNCGKIITSGARNIVCEHVTLQCSLRSLYKIKRKRFLKKLNILIKEITIKDKMNIFISTNKYIPQVANDIYLFNKYRHLIDEVVSPVFQAEDFSFYGIETRSLYLFLGVGNTFPLHSSKFTFDTSVLEKGLEVLKAIAI